MTRAYLCGALKCQRTGTVGKLFLLDKTQIEPHDSSVRHDGTRDRAYLSQKIPIRLDPFQKNSLMRHTGGFGGREQLVPVVHDGKKGFKADFSGTRDEPADHLSPTPIDRRERHPHDLQTEFKGYVKKGRMSRSVLRRGEPEGVLGQLEEMRRAVDVALGRLEYRPKPVNITFSGAEHGGSQGALLRFNVTQREPARIPTEHQ